MSESTVRKTSLVQFFRSIVQEMKRVTWPTRQEVWSTSAVVIVGVLISGTFLWIVDSVITLFFQQLHKWLR